MMHKLLSAILCSLLLLGFFVSPASAQDRSKEIRTLMEQRDREIKALIGSKKTFTEQQRSQLKNMINGVIDFEAMGRSALGPHWNKLTPAQRTDFVNVFSEIVRAQSLADVDMYRTQVAYKKISVQGDSAYVETQVTYKNVPAKVNYDMGYKGGKWRVEDIVLDNVSTTAGYARSFQAVVRKRGFDALMTSLRKKLQQVNTAAAK